MVDTLFQFEIYIKIWLFTYFYMVSFMNITLLLSNTHSKKYHNLFWKAIYFGNKLLKNRSEHSLFMLIWYFGFTMFTLMNVSHTCLQF